MSLPVLLLLLCSAQASHFFGALMTYYPKEAAADGSVRVVLRYKLNVRSCTFATWDCLSGNCGTEQSKAQNNVGIETSEWCQTEEISTRLLSSNAPFQLQFSSGDWIDNVHRIASWSAVTLVELRNRSDTSRANTSPQTTILPAVRVPSNCQRDFRLLAFDPDGDNVKCRYGLSSQSECVQCTPPSVLSLSSSSCTLSFSPTSSSNQGSYVVQLVMEDFPRQTITLTQTNGAQTTRTVNDALSKIPVQFAVKVDPAAPSCTEGLYLPRFLPPTPANGAQLFTAVNQTLEISISAEANNSQIAELLFSGPYDVIQNTLGGGRFSLSWTPSQREDGESHPICFVIQSKHTTGTKYHSELRCVAVRVRGSWSTTPPPTTTTTPQPTTTTTTPSPTTATITTPPPTTTTTPMILLLKVGGLLVCACAVTYCITSCSVSWCARCSVSHPWTSLK